MNIVGFQDQRTARITVAGRDATGGGDANVGGSNDGGTISASADSIGDDWHAGPLQVVGHTGSGVGDSAPAGSNTGLTGISRVRAGNS